MQMTRRFKRPAIVWMAVVAGAAVLASCDRGETPAPAAKTSPVPPAPPPPLPLGAKPEIDSGPDGGVSPAHAVVATGEWSENRMYNFRLERVAACGEAAPTLGPAQPPAAGAVTKLRGESSWVGALFSVQAKDPKVFVTPRDVELRRGGVILNARHINQPLLADCTPLLTAKLLRAGESVSGFALFEVPKTFRTKTDDPIVLSYRPTRWGGARKVDVPIRECLDACPETSKTAGRTPAIARKKL